MKYTKAIDRVYYPEMQNKKKLKVEKEALKIYHKLYKAAIKAMARDVKLDSVIINPNLYHIKITYSNYRVLKELLIEDNISFIDAYFQPLDFLYEDFKLENVKLHFSRKNVKNYIDKYEAKKLQKIMTKNNIKKTTAK